MKLSAIKRNARSKGETNKLRREGYIPAIIYHNGKAGEAIAVSLKEYDSFMRTVKAGHLPTQRITLAIKEGKEVTGIIKEIQYHPTTYLVWHIDFLELQPEQKIDVKIPLECLGGAECVGAKAGAGR